MLRAPLSREELPYASELYSAYSAGRLSPAYALLVETQAALRADIARDLAISEAITGTFFENESRELMAPNAFEKTLKQIEALEDGGADSLAAASSARDGLNELLALPEPLRDKALMASIGKGWSRLTRGVSRLDLSDSIAVHAHLYKIKPGSSVPRHSHHGPELTLVLQGGFSDQTGDYGPGDISYKTPQDTHQPIADDDGVCLALAVSEGGMRFTGMLGLIQKLTRK